MHELHDMFLDRLMACPEEEMASTHMCYQLQYLRFGLATRVIGDLAVVVFTSTGINALVHTSQSFGCQTAV